MYYDLELTMCDQLICLLWSRPLGAMLEEMEWSIHLSKVITDIKEVWCVTVKEDFLMILAKTMACGLGENCPEAFNLRVK